MRSVEFEIGANSVPCYGYIHDDLSALTGNYRLRPAVIVLPGGGYEHLAKREMDPIVMPLLAAGYQVFLFLYSVDKQIETSIPEEEIALCIKEIKDRAEEFDVDKDKMAVLGFSAGGHLAASIACHWPKYGEESKPDCAVLGYPAIVTRMFADMGIEKYSEEKLDYYSLERQVTEKTIPCFIWATSEDELVNVRNSLVFYNTLLDHHVPSELHIYQKGPHGLSLGHLETGPERKNVQSWYSLAVHWLNERWDFTL